MREADDLKKEESQYKLLRAEMVDKACPAQLGKNKFGLGSTNFFKKNRALDLADKSSMLHKVDEELTQAHLDKLVSVSLILDMHDGREPKEKMLYFMEDGRVLKVNEDDLMLRSGKELEYVLFLFKIKNDACARWKKKMEDVIDLQKKGMMARAEYKPKYVNAYGKEVKWRGIVQSWRHC